MLTFIGRYDMDFRDQIQIQIIQIFYKSELNLQVVYIQIWTEFLISNSNQTRYKLEHE